MKQKVAILIDGDFYIRMYFRHFNETYKTVDPHVLAKSIQTHCFKHIHKEDEELYRIFFYDCKPISKKTQNPLTNKPIDFSKSDIFKVRTDLHSALLNTPRLSLRLGYLDEANAYWTIKPDKSKNLLSKKIEFDDLQEEDIKYFAKQKGVDMRIGIDISTLTLKKQVDKIILISGDSDFVPAAKLARREGIIFTLDPMRNPIREDLKEHIDYLTTTLPPKK